ncbi:reverse transcriptase domain, reverse transcriptase zinc-binding domain protein, partial [Tanacetum coccineum]
MFTVVKDTIVDGQWTWPHEWILRYHILVTLGVPAIVPNALDNLEWRSSSGTTMNFFVLSVWECIRARGDEVNWCDVVWFSNCIPRHAFHLWLVIKRKLKTQDTLRQWDVSINANLNMFQCPSAGILMLATSLNAIIDHIIPMSKKKNARSVIAKLLCAASSYFIWQERNNRLFKSQKRSPNQIIECIISTVRLKLLTCSFKKTNTVMSFMRLWKLHVSLMRSSS